MRVKFMSRRLSINLNDIGSRDRDQAAVREHGGFFCLFDPSRLMPFFAEWV